MGRKCKYEENQKLELVKECIEGRTNPTALSKETGVSRSRIRDWIELYQRYGSAGLRTEVKNRKYTQETKMAAVEAYLTGKYTQLEVCKKYEIRAASQLNSWIKRYNGYKGPITRNTGGEIVTKGRKTTFDERVEIVKACIEQLHDYNGVARAFQVSYQQVYSWTAKYEQFGVEALEDRRGKRKPESKMTDYEKLKVENKMLEAKNRRLELENEFLKKVKELRGGDA